MNKKEMGKKSRRLGKAFEKLVEKDLERQGWIVVKFNKQVEFSEGVKYGINSPDKQYPFTYGRLVTAKGQFNPFFKRIVGEGSGFPDFICIRIHKIPKYIYTLEGDYSIEQLERLQQEIRKCNEDAQIITSPNVRINQLSRVEVQLVESKINGVLDKQEKEKCNWIEENLQIPILVAKKEGKQIVYISYKAERSFTNSSSKRGG